MDAEILQRLETGYVIGSSEQQGGKRWRMKSPRKSGLGGSLWLLLRLHPQQPAAAAQQARDEQLQLRMQQMRFDQVSLGTRD